MLAFPGFNNQVRLSVLTVLLSGVRVTAIIQVCAVAQAGDQCAFILSEGLNEAGLGVSSLWDNDVTGYQNYSGTQDAVPRNAISFSVRFGVLHPSPELSFPTRSVILSSSP